MAGDDVWERRPAPPRPRRAILVAALVAAVVVAGNATRLPAVPPRSTDVLTVDGDAAPPARVHAIQIRLLDPTHLTDEPTPPLRIEGGDWPVTSGDARRFALRTGTEVRVYDARSLAALAVRPDAPSGRLAFTPEADALIFWERGALVLAPLDSSAPRTTDLPPEVVPFDLRPLPGGRAAVYGHARDMRGRPTGARHVLVADLRAQTLLADLPLPGAAAGNAPPGLGWDVQRERLYVVDAERRRITVVDLAAGAVAAEVQVDAGLLGGRVRGVHVSPDGRWLAISGDGSGVALVDAASLSLVASLGSGGRAAVGFDPASSLLYTSGPGPGEGGSVLLAIDLRRRRVIGTRTLLGPGVFSPATGVLAERL